ncbi:hypothetical protein ACJX0J_024932, partial [Zea mays]
KVRLCRGIYSELRGGVKEKKRKDAHFFFVFLCLGNMAITLQKSNLQQRERVQQDWIQHVRNFFFAERKKN